MHEPVPLDPIDVAVDALAGATSVLFVTGAGLSADSGLPTYRGVGGLYDGEDAEEGIPIEALLSGQMLRARPELTWKYLAQVAEACRGATFNRGHAVIAEIETALPRVWTLTQNVDGFHRAAGARNVIDIHGDLHDLQCTACGRTERVDEAAMARRLEALPPMCDECGGLLRPDVVLFGEALPLAKLETLERELNAGFDVVISVGTSSLFPYIAAPVVWAVDAGRTAIEINPAMTEVSELVTARIESTAAVALDDLWQRTLQVKG